MNIARFIQGDSAADKVVPATGATAHLTLFASAAMAFLAVFCLCFGLSANAVSERWSNALARVATIEVTSGDTADVTRTLAVLSTTPGIASAQEVSSDRQAELLAPWLGPDFPLDTLALPRLIEVQETRELDREGLIQRLQSEVPDARYLTPDLWRSQVADSAGRIGWLSLLLTAMTGGVVAIVITLAVTTSLATQSATIEILRLIGAEDEFIKDAFVRRFTLRALFGAAGGTLLAILFLVSLTRGGDSVLQVLQPGTAGWVLILLIPVISAAIAYAATWRTADRILTRLT